MRLFDALENKKVYAADALCNELGLNPAQLADEKYYLSQVLLRSLRNFDDETQPANSIYNAFGCARALYHRGLYSYSLNQTEKILNRINKLELYSVALDVIFLKQSCLRRLSKFKELREMEEEYRILRSCHHELFEMTQLSYAITELEQKRGTVKEAQKLLASPIFKHKPNGLRTFIVWFNLKCYEHILLKGDAVKWVDFVRKSVTYCAQKPQILDMNPLGYLYMYTDLASAEMGIGNYEGAIREIDKLLRLLDKPAYSTPTGEIEKARLFAHYLKAHALRYLYKYQDAAVIAKMIYEQRNSRPVYDQFSFTFEYILNLLHCNKAPEAIDLINELLQVNTVVRSDYQQVLRVIIVMAHIDLGNFDVVPYLIKSGKIWLKRNKIENKEYQLFFILAGNIAKAGNPKLRSKAFNDLSDAVSAMKMPDLDRELDFKNWIAEKS